MPTSNIDQVLTAPDRRTFLAQICAGGLLCVGCSHRAVTRQPTTGQQPTAEQQPTTTPPAPTHKFAADSKWTFEQIYGFTYSGVLIPLLKTLADEVGREKLLPMLQEAASKVMAQGAREYAPPPPKNTAAAHLPPHNHFWDHVLTYDVIESTEKAAELHVTECLWAKTFREAGASEIGYAIICHPDFAAAPAYNPKMRMIRTKTLMQGHDCCNHRWVIDP